MQSPSQTETEEYSDDGRPILFYVEALYDYAATTDKEFDFKAGDAIAVTEMIKDDWWHGQLVDRARRQPGRHTFPRNYVSAPRGQQLPRTETHATGDDQSILFYAKALYDSPSTVDQELDFKAGDIIAVTDTPEDGWWWGGLLDDLFDGSRGQTARRKFPNNFVSAPLEELFPHLPSPPNRTHDGRSILFHVTALYDYSPRAEHGLDFNVGDIIAVTSAPQDGWWRGHLLDKARQQTGWCIFPSSCVSAPLKHFPLHLPSLTRYTDDGQPILFYVEARYDYTATIDTEFDFQGGDIIAVTEVNENGWWCGELLDETRREAGRDVFPSNFVTLL